MKVSTDSKGDGQSRKPRNPSGKGGRAQTSLSPIKSWSGGLTAEETAVWEVVANAIREKGVRPSQAANAAGMGRAWKDHRRRRTPLYHHLNQCWQEAICDMIGEIRDADSWQAKAWILERSCPEDFALDSAIRKALNAMAQDAGFPIPDLMDAARTIREAQESGIDVKALLDNEIKRRESQALVL